MNILMVYPECPDTYWSFRHALRFIAKKAAVPPLGLITISAMLPQTWNKKLVDMNISDLQTSDIVWADYVFISAMYVQKGSVEKVIDLCKKLNTRVVAGGPLFTQEYDHYPQVDHFVLNEGEITFPEFLDDLNNGRPLKRIYETQDYADLSCSPTPDFGLLSIKDYASMSLQVTRGCPYACDFCEITSLLGRKVRMKSTQQILDELDALYHLNWRGQVSVVDDNFIGRKKAVKTDLLPAMVKWMRAHKYPFTFSMQTSINLADDVELMSLMADAGFSSTFIGIETPDELSLNDCKKIQNKNRDLIESVKKIQNRGIQVSGGFIVGFDSDTPRIFQQQIDFIQQSGIVSAMVGLLNAPKHTKLYNRLKAENRLMTQSSGNNTDCSMNFIPKMDHQELLEGYKHIIQNIYSVKPYYKRVRQALLHYKKHHIGNTHIELSKIGAFLKSIVVLGILKKGRSEFWKLFFWTLIHRPKLFIDAITFAVYGYHYRMVYGLRR